MIWIPTTTGVSRREPPFLGQQQSVATVFTVVVESPGMAQHTSTDERRAHAGAGDTPAPDSVPVRTFAIFVVGTLAFSWGLWALLLLDLVPPSATGALVRIGGFGPFVGALVALLASGWSIRQWLRANLRVRLPTRWYLCALVLPPLFIVAAGLVHATLFGARIDLGAMNPLWFYPIAVVVVFFVGGGQEELGWRAFALPALQGRFSALTASLAVGVVWAVWHVPLFLLPGSGQSDLPLGPYVVAVLAISVVLAWLYNASESVLVPMLFHGGINPIAAYFPTGGVDAVGTLTGYGSYALVLLGAVVVLLGIYGPGRLADRPRVTLSDLLTTESETTQ
jgi:membrane protease YdiL (CAAX protease family)